MRRNRRAEVCFSANAQEASPTCASNNANGWITFIDTDRSGAFNAGDVLLRTATIKAPLVLLADSKVAGKVVFRSDGMVHDSTGGFVDGTIDLCIPTRSPGDNVRHVQIDAGSRVSIVAANGAGQCSAP